MNKTYNILDYSEYFSAKKDSLSCGIKTVDFSRIYGGVTNLKDNNEGHLGIKHIHSLDQNDGISISLLFCFMLLIHVYRKGFSFFKENIHLTLFSQTESRMSRESTASDFWYNFLLILQTTFLFSLVSFVYFLETKTDVIHPKFPFLMVLSFTLLFLLLEVVKCLFYKFTGYIFDLQKVVSTWIRAYTFVVKITGIFSFIPALFLIYFDYYHDILFVFFILLFIFSRLIIIYRLSLFFLQKNVNFLYLIAYLCSIEIIPYILLYKGMVYLYENEIINLIWL